MHQHDITLELYISDDRSTDDSLAICERWAGQDPRIHLLPPPEHSGCTGNFFHLIRSVNLGPDTHLALSDQDDIWDLHKLKRGVQKLQQNTADGYSASVTAFWPSGEEILLRKHYPQRKADFLFEGPGPGCTFILTPRLAAALQTYLRQHHAIEANLHIHDWFIYAWARSRHYRWIIDEHPSVLYRQHKNNTIGANHGVKALLTRLKQVMQGPFTQQMFFQARLLYPDDRLPVPLGSRRINWLRMVLHATHCRRRPRDRWLLALVFIMLALRPKGIGK
jgi:rhamnosyltransferase